jgi:hypothetical protein
MPRFKYWGCALLNTLTPPTHSNQGRQVPKTRETLNEICGEQNAGSHRLDFWLVGLITLMELPKFQLSLGIWK